MSWHNLCAGGGNWATPRYVCNLDELFDSLNGVETWWGHVAAWLIISGGGCRGWEVLAGVEEVSWF